MFYLFWLVLNIAAMITVIYYCFRAFGYLRPKLGAFISIIIVLVLLSFVTDTGKDANSSSRHYWKINPAESTMTNSNDVIKVTLEKNWTCQYKLYLQYGKEKTSGKLIPVSASVPFLGISSGTDWSLVMVTITPTEDEKAFQYDIYGKVNWKLLSIKVYSEQKHWKGILRLK